jgi:hypothetical protein
MCNRNALSVPDAMAPKFAAKALDMRPECAILWAT